MEDVLFNWKITWPLPLFRALIAWYDQSNFEAWSSPVMIRLHGAHVRLSQNATAELIPIIMNVRSVKIVTAIAILLVLCSAGWQIGKWELANVELRDDLHDMSSQLGARIGLTNGLSDEDFRNEVVRKARKYDIPLAPEQVTVVRSGEGIQATMYFAADYTVPVQLPGFSFRLHFNPESGSKPTV